RSPSFLLVLVHQPPRPTLFPYTTPFRSQVHRLVTGIPERLNLQVFAALCDILDAGPAELFEPVVITSTRRKTAEETGPLPAAPPGEARRPRRARIVPDEP